MSFLEKTKRFAFLSIGYTLVTNTSSMDPLERLTALFEKFPGIGPRQANRFVQFLLRSSPSLRRELVSALQGLNSGVQQCTQCMRFQAGKDSLCTICRNPHRNNRVVTIVATDTDLAALERSGSYNGYYFVLGGLVTLAGDKNPSLHTQQFLDSLSSRTNQGLEEIILAFPANPEGDATAGFIREMLSHSNDQLLKITSLGRGLSTGSELEYADPDTIRSALESRK